MKTRGTAEHLINQAIESVRQATIQAFLKLPIPINESAQAFSIITYILAIYLKKLSVGCTQQDNSIKQHESSQECEDKTSNDGLEEQLMRVFIRQLVSQNLKFSDQAKLKDKQEVRNTVNETSMLSLISEKSRIREKSKMMTEQNQDIPHRAQKAISRLNKLESYLMSPKHKCREQAQPWDITIGKDYYIQQNKYLKQMQNIMRVKLQAFEGKQEDVSFRSLESKLEDRANALRRKQQELKGLQNHLIKREQGLNSKQSQLIRRQKLRS